MQGGILLNFKSQKTERNYPRGWLEFAASQGSGSTVKSRSVVKHDCNLKSRDTSRGEPSSIILPDHTHKIILLVETKWRLRR